MDRLTPRQREIVVMRCRDGLTNGAVGHELGIALSTVKNHWTRVMAKVGTCCTGQTCWVLRGTSGQAHAIRRRARAKRLAQQR